MEQALTNFFQNRFTPRGIFEARNAKFFRIALQLLLASLILGFPLSIQIYNLDMSGFVRMMYQRLSSDTSWIAVLSEAAEKGECAVASVGDEMIVYTPEDMPPPIDSDKFILLTNSYTNMRYMGIDVYGDNVGAPVEILSQGNQSPDELLSALLEGARYGFFSILSLMIYPVVILLNVIFIAVLSLVSLSLNYAANIELHFKEYYAYFCYAATIPALLSLIVGSFTSIAFVYLIYNFLLVILAYGIYIRMQRSGPSDESFNGKRHLI